MSAAGEQDEFRSLLIAARGAWPVLSDDRIEALVKFRALVVEENETQNLTRLLSPLEFFEGHVLDCLELERSRLVITPAMDLGSGGGVPGVIMAILGQGPWVLAESEGNKADFLRRAVERLALGDVEVFRGRAEEFLKTRNVVSVVARAVGPVERIFAWIKGCSTWNNLVLLKGPGWDEEWARFGMSSHRKGLTIDRVAEYSVGAENKRRLIIRLARQ